MHRSKSCTIFSLLCDNLANCFGQFMSLSEHEKTEIMDDGGVAFKELGAFAFRNLTGAATATWLVLLCRDLLGEAHVQDLRRAVYRFQALLASARLLSVRQHAVRLQHQGYECFGRCGGVFWCGLFHSGRSMDAMLARFARPCLEPRRHRLRRAAAISGRGVVPRECGDDLPRNAAIQLCGQQDLDH